MKNERVLELRDLFEEYLPQEVEYEGDMFFGESGSFKGAFVEMNFPEVMERFVYDLCKKQREICVKAYLNSIDHDDVEDNILNAEQPKISDLI